MSTETASVMETAGAQPATETPAPQGWPALGVHERRVLGVLVEKAKTTPDVYPLSLNGLITGCNQKSNRDPLLALGNAEVQAALDDLKAKGYVQQLMGGGRVDKFKHTLYETLNVDKVQLAILAELLLRGAQTEGELRARASRMEPIADLETLRGQLRLLSERGLVVFLGPEGRRGTTITHGFHSAEELEPLRADDDRGAPASPARASSAANTELLQRVQALEQGLVELRQQVEQLQAAFGRPAGVDQPSNPN